MPNEAGRSGGGPARSLTLVLGGARSGKSDQALALATRYRRVLFVATAEALDDDMVRRIARHRTERPAHWATIEEPRALATVLARVSDDTEVVVIDCITLWASNLLLAGALGEDVERGATREAGALLAAYERSAASWIVISNEVGLGLVPEHPVGRAYRDALGRVNQVMAAAADEVLFMVAGIPWPVKHGGR